MDHFPCLADDAWLQLPPVSPPISSAKISNVVVLPLSSSRQAELFVCGSSCMFILAAPRALSPLRAKLRLDLFVTGIVDKRMSKMCNSCIRLPSEHGSLSQVKNQQCGGSIYTFV